MTSNRDGDQTSKSAICGCLALLLALSGCNQRVGIWHRSGTVLQGGSVEEYSVQEPTLLYDAANSRFRLWFTCGWINNPGICYATSVDGVGWTRLNNASNPSIANLYHAFIFLDSQNATYYAYGVDPYAQDAGFVRYHSQDGLAWVMDAKGILSPTGTGWSAQWNGNTYVWIEGSTWYILYEMYSGKAWQVGEATSSDGIHWSPYTGNPVITYPGSGCGGPEMHKVRSTYYVWATCSPRGLLPTNIYRFSSSDLHTWTRSDGNAAGAVFSRITTDEGSDSSGGQVADPSMVEVNGSTFLMYDATDTQNPRPGDGIHLKLAMAFLSIEQIVDTREGNAPDMPGFSPLSSAHAQH